MNDYPQPHAIVPPILRVAAGEDLSGECRGLAVSDVAFKVSLPDPNGLLVLENTLGKKRGPAHHLHYDQDEWFYVVEGEFIIEIGQERLTLNPGDSILAPRKVSHAWAYVGETRGRLLIAFMPAGQMEAYFDEATKANAMPSQDPEFWRAHGMELLGSPLLIE